MFPPMNSTRPLLYSLRQLLGAATAIGLALVLITSCGSSGDASTGTAAASSEEAADGDTSDDSANSEDGFEAADAQESDAQESLTSNAPIDEGDEFTSPINDLLGVDFDSFEDMNFEAMAVVGELEMQRCMNEQGFEYTPVDHSADFADGASLFLTDPAIEIGSLEYAETYGLGISTLVDEQIDQRARLTAADSGVQDPNPAYRASLPEAAQLAYDIALEGPEDASRFAPGGCTAEVLEAVDMDVFVRFGAFMVEFPDYAQDVAARVEADPRVLTLSDDYARCMADDGYSFANQAEMYQSIIVEWSPLQAEIFGDAPFMAMIEPTETAGAADPGDVTAELEVENRAPEITDEVRSEIDDLADREIAVAVASWGCSEGHDEVRRTVQTEFEQNFIDENQAAITAFLEAQGT